MLVNTESDSEQYSLSFSEVLAFYTSLVLLFPIFVCESSS